MCDSEAEASVPQRENTQSSTSSINLEPHWEPIRIVPCMSAFKLQMALSDRLLPTANMKELLKAKGKK